MVTEPREPQAAEEAPRSAPGTPDVSRSPRLKLLHLGLSRSRMPEEGPFVDELRAIGELTIRKDADAMSVEQRAALIRECDVLLTMWGSAMVPIDIARDPGRLRYICNITGEMKNWVPLELIESGIPVTNWGDASADEIAEAAMALLLCAAKDIVPQTRHIERGGWRLADHRRGMIRGLRVGLYGFGVIGRRFAALLQPFGARLTVYDPFAAELVEGVARAETLDALFAGADAVAIHAGLTAETRGSVTAERLAMLPDHAILINTARGDIVDQEALFAELARGRLRAGLDVVAGSDELEPDHPARQWDNCILTAHMLAKQAWNLPRLLYREEICLDNLRRHMAGEELRFRIDRDRYLRMT